MNKYFNKEEIKNILYFPILVVQMVGWVFRYVVCVWCRCKITGEKYYGGDKTTGKFPVRFYKLRNGLRYYESGEIAKEDYRGRCEMVLSPQY